MESLSRKLPFSKKTLPAKVVLSYVLDYVIIIVLIAGFTILDAVEPYHQKFSLQNYTLHYPYAVKERVPVPFLVVLVCFVPAAVIALYTLVIDGIFSHQPPAGPSSGRRKLLGRYRLKDRLWELNCGILGLALSVAAAFTITGALKNAIGKPRPDLIDRCQPPPGTVDPQPWGLSNHSICTQTDNAILKDGFRSFPSGHSSTAFAGLFYLSIYLAAKLHVLDSKGEVWKTFIVLVPTLSAGLIAGTRIMDARHHPFDVLSGSLMGMLVAWGSYRQYFPPVSETWRKGRAYPIRAWGKEPVAP
ncbi:phosphatidic acid phosphatase type 2/haloperoxidase, partial [Lineolata rhizophorae]